jgi:hypothetical protein
MRIKELIYKGKSYTDKVLIETYLYKHGFNWLNKAEIENAIIEIKNDKLYWHSGIWYYGDFGYGIWLDGIFKFGNFVGVWHNGLFKNGTFDGIWMNGNFENGDIIGGEFRKGILKGEVKNDVLKFSEYFKK